MNRWRIGDLELDRDESSSAGRYRGSEKQKETLGRNTDSTRIVRSTGIVADADGESAYPLFPQQIWMAEVNCADMPGMVNLYFLPHICKWAEYWL